MNATFAGLEPLPGSLALVSQSGAVGIVLVEQARTSGIDCQASSLSGTASTSAPRSALLLRARRAHRGVALYLESLETPQVRKDRPQGRCKQAHRGAEGRVTPAGARGARSHTAAAATPQVVVSALLQGAGVIRWSASRNSLMSRRSSSPRHCRGESGRVGRQLGGPLILAADACEGGGLAVPELDQATRAALREVVTPTPRSGTPST